MKQFKSLNKTVSIIVVAAFFLTSNVYPSETQSKTTLRNNILFGPDSKSQATQRFDEATLMQHFGLSKILPQGQATESIDNIQKNNIVHVLLGDKKTLIPIARANAIDLVNSKDLIVGLNYKGETVIAVSDPLLTPEKLGQTEITINGFTLEGTAVTLPKPPVFTLEEIGTFVRNYYDKTMNDKATNTIREMVTNTEKYTPKLLKEKLESNHLESLQALTAIYLRGGMFSMTEKIGTFLRIAGLAALLTGCILLGSDIVSGDGSIQIGTKLNKILDSAIIAAQERSKQIENLSDEEKGLLLLMEETKLLVISANESIKSDNLSVAGRLLIKADSKLKRTGLFDGDSTTLKELNEAISLITKAYESTGEGNFSKANELFKQAKVKIIDSWNLIDQDKLPELKDAVEKASLTLEEANAKLLSKLSESEELAGQYDNAFRNTQRYLLLIVSSLIVSSVGQLMVRVAKKKKDIEDGDAATLSTIMQHYSLSKILTSDEATESIDNIQKNNIVHVLLGDKKTLIPIARANAIDLVNSKDLIVGLNYKGETVIAVSDPLLTPEKLGQTEITINGFTLEGTAVTLPKSPVFTLKEIGVIVDKYNKNIDDLDVRAIKEMITDKDTYPPEALKNMLETGNSVQGLQALTAIYLRGGMFSAETERRDFLKKIAVAVGGVALISFSIALEEQDERTMSKTPQDGKVINLLTGTSVNSDIVMHASTGGYGTVEHGPDAHKLIYYGGKDDWALLNLNLIKPQDFTDCRLDIEVKGIEGVERIKTFGISLIDENGDFVNLIVHSTVDVSRDGIKSIDLSQIEGVNLSKVKRIVIHFGARYSSREDGGFGEVEFENPQDSQILIPSINVVKKTKATNSKGMGALGKNVLSDREVSIDTGVVWGTGILGSLKFLLDKI